MPIQFEETIPSEGANRLCRVEISTSRPYGKAVRGMWRRDRYHRIKRGRECRPTLARERELFAQQRVTELAKANGALRGCSGCAGLGARTG